MPVVAQPEGGEVSRQSLERVLHLYEGIWGGSIDLTSYHGEVIASILVKKEYRIVLEGGEPVLLGRFEFGDRSGKRISLSRTTIEGDHLVNVISQMGEDSSYQGTIDKEKLVWVEMGKTEEQTTKYYDQFIENEGARAIVTNSRNVIEDAEGVSATVFTAGQFIYEGPPGTNPIEDWLSEAAGGVELTQNESAEPGRFDGLKSQLSETKQAYDEATAELDKLRKQLSEAQAEVDRLQKSLEERQ
ncbi:hypothetical protein [Rubellicoccus peritrichatus]|uniref:Uncharacterized protein n=1 Tax=Rubellicoccus peritrichatus TaxID=3080537 RepID=A0AAQ3LIX4_9BACT|nr:hypothetical protein [Puniceicoccus sp. CR14]WOO42979.1 hypothetical protein RZN69_07725 [Puniceicoccus sp. CR14]